MNDSETVCPTMDTRPDEFADFARDDASGRERDSKCEDFPAYSEPEESLRNTARRWTINGDFLGLSPYGVARYAREVVCALDRLIEENHPLTRNLEIDIVAPLRPPEGSFRSIDVRVVPEFKYPRLPQVWVQVQLPRHVRGGLLSFCNLAPIAVTRHIACIHDLHTRLIPESYSPLFRLAHRAILPALGRQAAFITTVSDFSRQHLIDYGVAPADKIVVTYNGSDHASRWDASRSTLELPRRPYVMSLGRNQHHKNIGLLLKLAPLLDRMGLDLVMAGEVEPATILQHVPQVPGNLVLLGHITDDDFRKALSGALCFLFPSRVEGFGLPAVEAMTCGCPVVASSAPCLPEVCGEAAIFADPDDTDAWIEKIGRLQESPSFRRSMVDAGLQRAENYRWARIAETYLELMASLDGAGATASDDGVADAANTDRVGKPER